MFWSRQTILARQQVDPLILPAADFDQSRVVRGAYELSIGGQAYITSDTGKTVDLKPGERVIIPPGQFGILITKEFVKIPVDVIGFISIKAGEKFRGLVNVSGFHVDPGYNGPLKFAVYNAGPKPVELDQGKAVFLIWFAQLDHAEEIPYPNDQRPGRTKITDEDVAKIQGDIASPGALKERFDKYHDEIDKRLRPIELFQKVTGVLFGRVTFIILGLVIGGLIGKDVVGYVWKQVIALNQPAEVKDPPPTPKDALPPEAKK